MEKERPAAESFDRLSDEAYEQLGDLNDRIQEHDGPWGKAMGGERDENGVIAMPWVESDPLIMEFVQFLYDKDLVIPFDWGSWEEGREWYELEDESKYDELNTEMALKLLTAVVRNDRFSEGALVSAFESGDFPKIIGKLVSLRRK